MKDERNMKFVQYIKDCGQSLIDNAETMVDYKYLKDIIITCHIIDDEAAPYIKIDAEYYPEDLIKRWNEGA